MWVVDDDKDFLDALEFILSAEDWKSQSSKGFLWQEASRNNVPGCLILDFFMPIKNGLEVQAEIKKINPRLSIIFLTGHKELNIAINKYDANLGVTIQDSKNDLFNSLTDREKKFSTSLLICCPSKKFLSP